MMASGPSRSGLVTSWNPAFNVVRPALYGPVSLLRMLPSMPRPALPPGPWPIVMTSASACDTRIVLRSPLSYQTNSLVPSIFEGFTPRLAAPCGSDLARSAKSRAGSFRAIQRSERMVFATTLRSGSSRSAAVPEADSLFSGFSRCEIERPATGTALSGSI